MAQSKRVLVLVGVNSREVTISSHVDEPIEALKHATRVAFEDVLPKDAEFFFQMKDAHWDGEFVDLQPAHPVLDRSVLKVVQLHKQVRTLSCQLFRASGS